ncbi:serine/threonine-protein kinase [Mycobacterium sp.]|uniref:serine/threonine-protein kinase n=1 Tax=Mycobacterium sp. TaxID=1785 RepID=UPI002BA3E9DB|nr:serine/threonine-protein kinase [Mycobacterium sp.]HTQ21578.1 serine/threonine-protein kinase [Mycobacterium sp.]
MEGVPFGRYRLIQVLGAGGMGEVWRAHDTDTDRIVAIKVLPAYLSGDETFKERFRREAHAAAQLNTPHVIPIHHFGEIDGRLYVDMRLIEGRDLQTALEDGPIAPARAVRIVEGVAKALHAAHKVGLVHRDVKPSNILLDDDEFPYLIDFGIARSANDSRLTKTGSMIGTLQYMAPERMGSGQEDARADIYALACVLYECLTGTPPFPADSPERLMMAHLRTPPPQPSSATSEVPAQFDTVIATGMAKEPDQRYSSPIELADAAREAVTVPIPRPAPSPAPTPPPARSKPGPAMAPAVGQDKPSQPPTILAPAETQQRPETLPAYAARREPPPATAPAHEYPQSPAGGRGIKIGLGIGATVLLLVGVAVPLLVSGLQKYRAANLAGSTDRNPTFMFGLALLGIAGLIVAVSLVTLIAKSTKRGVRAVVGITVALLLSFGLAAVLIVTKDHNKHEHWLGSNREGSIILNPWFVMLIFGVICLAVAAVVIVASLVIRIATLGRRAVSSGQLQSGSRSPGESFSRVGAERHDTSSSR